MTAMVDRLLDQAMALEAEALALPKGDERDAKMAEAAKKLNLAIKAEDMQRRREGA